MPVHTITVEEKDRLNGQACELFKVRNPDFYPCQANSDKLIIFVESQLGTGILDYPYPVTIDMWQAAYDHIKATSWFYARPEEVEVEDPAVVRERMAQERVRAEYDAQQRAAKIRRDRNMPIGELGKVVSVQNADLREQRDANVLPGRPVGPSSRTASTITMGLKAQARANVALANPSLDRNGEAFAKRYAAELSRLRS